MGRYIVRRLLMIIPIAFGVTTLTFFLLKIAPGDPALAFLGDQATPAMVANLNKSLGLDEPLLVQYFTFVFHIARGDFGQSFIYRVPVLQLIEAELPTTLLLMVVGVSLPRLSLCHSRFGHPSRRAPRWALWFELSQQRCRVCRRSSSGPCSSPLLRSKRACSRSEAMGRPSLNICRASASGPRRRAIYSVQHSCAAWLPP